MLLNYLLQIRAVQRLDGLCLLTFALELKEQLAQTLAGLTASILTQPRGRVNAEEAAEPPLRQIITVLQQLMCTHYAEKLAIAVLEIYGGESEPKGDHQTDEIRRVKAKVYSAGVSLA
jgi:hypothetical protein